MRDMSVEVYTESAEDTIRLGEKFGRQLNGGEVVCLIGPLGSGKTHFIKGVARGAASEQGSEHVNSPTFVLVNEYKGRVDIYHIDAYRIESEGEFDMLGFDDFCYPDSAVFIEWADKVEGVWEDMDVIRVEFVYEGHARRRIVFDNPGDIEIG